MRTLVFLAVCLGVCGGTPQDLVDVPIKDAVNNTRVPLPDGRIVGGLATQIESFPYQVSLSYSEKHNCGGSILRGRVVVTAAHCVHGRRPQLLAVRAGSSQHNQGGVVVPVEKIVIHPKFNPSTLDCDIALLVLSSDLPLSAAINSISLATAADSLDSNAALIVSGWGATNEGFKATSILQYTQVQLISQARCSRSYRATGDVVSSNMLCAGMPQGGHDSCQGDSGGPLIAYKGTEAKLHGIVSWGYGCARPYFPGVYTRVVKMGPWVESTLKGLGYKKNFMTKYNSVL